MEWYCTVHRVFPHEPTYIRTTLNDWHRTPVRLDISLRAKGVASEAASPP
jgi:hypothetical protein